jgi:hypothetical protein
MIDSYYELARLTLAAVLELSAPREKFWRRASWAGEHEHLLARVGSRWSAALRIGGRNWTTVKTPGSDRGPSRVPAPGIGTVLLDGQSDRVDARQRSGSSPRRSDRWTASAARSGRAEFRACGSKGAAEVRRQSRPQPPWTRPSMRAAGRRLAACQLRLIFWHGSVPEEHLPRAAYLDGRLLEDAPLGELDWEPAKMDTSRFRSMERAVMARRRRPYNAGAVHNATGRLAAFTALSMDATIPDHAWQNITIVDLKHRGHRLGLLIKLANLVRVRRAERRPPCSTPGTRMTYR